VLLAPAQQVELVATASVIAPTTWRTEIRSRTVSKTWPTTNPTVPTRSSEPKSAE
jgi:hypothetical protein